MCGNDVSEWSQAWIQPGSLGRRNRRQSGNALLICATHQVKKPYAWLTCINNLLLHLLYVSWFLTLLQVGTAILVYQKKS